jgi:cell division protein ZapA (FtsZ GTPase activity inhibitor)
VGKTHEVVLLGKKFKLRSTHDDDYLSDLARYVTEQVGDVQRRGAASTLDAALLAALNIADELHRLKKEAEERLAAIGEKTQALLSALDEHVETPVEVSDDGIEEDALPAGVDGGEEAVVDEALDKVDASRR